MSKDENKKKKNVKNNSSFVKESKSELKKVSWPKPKALVNDTMTVISIVLIVALIVFVLDMIFYQINKNVIVNNEQKVVNSTVVNNENNNVDLTNLNVEDLLQNENIEVVENDDVVETPVEEVIENNEAE